MTGFSCYIIDKLFKPDQRVEFMAGESNRIRNKKMGEEEEKPLPRIVPKGSGVYYSNCALVTSSHRELSVLFGRIGPAEGVTGLAEVYERHIYMTVEQAIDVAARDSDDRSKISGKSKNIGRRMGQAIDVARAILMTTQNF